MSAMQYSGYLDASGNATERAKEIFLIHREDLVLNRSKFKFKCVPMPEEGIGDIVVLNVRDKSTFLSFHEVWPEGIYTTCLKILDVASNIDPLAAPPSPIFDILALSEKLKKPATTAAVYEVLDFDALCKQFFLPLGAITLIGPKDFLAITPELQTQFETEVKAVTADYSTVLPKAKDFILDPPSKNFPSLIHPEDSRFSLKDQQLSFFEGVVKALDDFTKHIKDNATTITTSLVASPDETLEKLYELACQKLDANFPQFAIKNEEEKDESFELGENVNRNALRRSLVKPLTIASFAMLFGSVKSGLVGKLGIKEPDSTTSAPTTTQKPKDFVEPPGDSNDSIVLAEDLEKTSPQFRRKLFNMARRLDPSNKVPNLADWIAVTMLLETAKTYSPSKRASDSKAPLAAVGLIQFTASAVMSSALSGIDGKTAADKLKTLEEMDALEQMYWVEKYYEAVIATYGLPNNPADSYLLVFSPEFKRNPNLSYVKPSKEYQQNVGLDANKDGKIVRSDIANKLDNLWYATTQKKKRIKVDSDEIFDAETK